MALLGAGCRSAGPAAAGAGEPPGAAPTQRLYRLQVHDGAERAHLRLVLRWWRAERFEVAASDPFGRALWSLAIADGAGAWRSGKQRQECRLEAARELRLPGLDLNLPAVALPPILLGQVPVPAAADGSPPPGARPGRFERIDAQGRRWSGEADAEGPLRWRLDDGEALEWTRTERGGRLRVAGRPLEISWREVAREPLGGSRPRLPAGLADLPECQHEDVP